MVRARHSRLFTLATLVAVALTLAGCGAGWLFGPGAGERREGWRNIADRRCLANRSVFRTGEVKRAKKVNGRGACGIPRPLEVRSLAGGRIAFDPPATLTCPVVPAADRWLRTSVQPAARDLLGSPVVSIDVAASYSCRTRNSRRGARLSEHAFGNALDVSAFRLADGRRVTVGGGWRGDLTESLFLRRVHGDACKHFKTVLGPDADRAHASHFHFDLARHNKDGSYHHCE